MFIRVLNAILGLWLFVSAFMLSRAPMQFVNVLLISLAVILVRILWVYPATYIPRLLFKRLRELYQSHISLLFITRFRNYCNHLYSF